MVKYIEAHVDFYEIVNQFPVLREKLVELDFRAEIKEGESAVDYFERNALSMQETDFLITRLNRELKSFLKNKQEAVAPPVQMVQVETITPEHTTQAEEE